MNKGRITAELRPSYATNYDDDDFDDGSDDNGNSSSFTTYKHTRTRKKTLNRFIFFLFL